MSDEHKLTIAELKEIFRKIATKEREHGSFLTCFAVAISAADEEDFRVLTPAALAFVARYQLWDYRHAQEDAL